MPQKTESGNRKYQRTKSQTRPQNTQSENKQDHKNAETGNKLKHRTKSLGTDKNKEYRVQEWKQT